MTEGGPPPDRAAPRSAEDCIINRKLFCKNRSNGIGRLPRAAAAFLLALLALMPACAENSIDKDAATHEPRAFEERAAEEGRPNKPTSSRPPLETEYRMPEGMEEKYSLHTLTVPAGSAGLHPSGVERFEISFILPNGWTVGGADTQVTGSFQHIAGEGKPLYQCACFMDEEGRVAAALSFAPYDVRSAADAESGYERIYEVLTHGDYQFLIDKLYLPFYNGTASNLTAVSKTRYLRPDGAVQYNPAVLSADPERGVFIAAEFAIGRINALQFMDFAESLCIY